VLCGDRLVIADGAGRIWTASQGGAGAWDSTAGGRLAVTGEDTVLSYDEQGIHRLDLDAHAAELVYALPGAFPGHTGILVLPGGAMLVVHEDAGGTSLSLLSTSGVLRWRHALPHHLRGQWRLFALDGDAYLLAESHTSAASEVSIYRVDLERVELTRILTSGSRQPSPSSTWALAGGEGHVLIHLGGTGMAYLDARAAFNAVAAREDTSVPLHLVSLP
jgi:hypothetical protein